MLGKVPFQVPGEQPVAPKDKSPLETIGRILAACVALSVLFAQWGQHPWLAAILLLVALLLIVSAFGPGLLRSYRAARAQKHRNKFARAQFPEVLEFVKRFGEFVDSRNGNNLRNVLFSGCGNNQNDFDKLCSQRDYLKEIWPHFFNRLQRTHSQDEVAFCNAVREFCTLVASYNNGYVLDPLKRIDDKLWPPVGKTTAPASELVPWLVSLPEHHRTSVKKQIKAFHQRWFRYLDDLELFLNKIKDSFNCPRMNSDNPSFFDSGKISSSFERPAPLE